MRLRKSALLVAGALALGLGACGDSGSDDGDVTLEWWIGNWDEEAANEIIADFESDNPDIKIDTVVMTWDTMANQIRVALDSGDVPNMITELTSRIPIYARAGQLADVTDWYDENMPRDDFYEAAVETASLDGVVHGIPFRWDAGSMVYNIDLFEQAGISEPPTTWAELQEAAQKIHDETGAYAYGWPYGDPSNARVRYLNAYYTNGGEFIENSDGTVSLDPEASLKAIEMVTQGFEEGYVTPSSLEASNTDLQNLLTNDQIAFYFEGAYAVAPLKEAGINVGTAMWPGVDGPATVSADGFSIIIPEGADNLEATKKFTQFMANTDNQALITETFPARYSSAENERFADPALQPFLEQHGEHAKNRPAYVGWEDMVPTIHSALQSVALGNITPEEANETILTHADQVLSLG